MNTRYKTVSVPVPFRTRFRWWIEGLWFAICEMPPSEERIFKELHPGDDGYEEAAFECVTKVGPSFKVDSSGTGYIRADQ